MDLKMESLEASGTTVSGHFLLLDLLPRSTEGRIFSLFSEKIPIHGQPVLIVIIFGVYAHLRLWRAAHLPAGPLSRIISLLLAQELLP